MNTFILDLAFQSIHINAISDAYFLSSEFINHSFDENSDVEFINVVSTEAIIVTITGLLFLFTTILGGLMWRKRKAKIKQKR